MKRAYVFLLILATLIVVAQPALATTPTGVICRIVEENTNLNLIDDCYPPQQPFGISLDYTNTKPAAKVFTHSGSGGSPGTDTGAVDSPGISLGIITAAGLGTFLVVRALSRRRRI